MFTPAFSFVCLIAIVALCRVSSLNPMCASDWAVGSELSSFSCALEGFQLHTILCDLDGTLLSDDHDVSSANHAAVSSIMSAGLPLYIATGRSRGSAMRATNALLPNLLKRPESAISGVFSQGLQVYGRGGKLIYERFLESSIIAEVADFCHTEKLSLIAYVGDRIMCKQRDTHTDNIVVYKEPLPEEFPQGLERLEELRGLKVNKLIVLAHESELVRTRPALSARLDALATITKAQAGMLEILPLGASKGVGVQKLLEHLNIHPDRVLAIGDGENDIEMLRMVGLSVAMGNANEIVQAAARVVGPRNTEDGVATILNEVRRHIDRAVR